MLACSIGIASYVQPARRQCSHQRYTHARGLDTPACSQHVLLEWCSLEALRLTLWALSQAEDAAQVALVHAAHQALYAC
jgi:hypothetical protein